jgi:DNA invertase Pin-like site-specific DNA recombinase
VWRIDRFGRPVEDLTRIINDLADRGIQCRFTTEAIGTTPIGGELVFHVFAAVAQMERLLIRERTMAGLTAARARGRRGGRPVPSVVRRVVDRKKLTAQAPAGLVP